MRHRFGPALCGLLLTLPVLAHAPHARAGTILQQPGTYTMDTSRPLPPMAFGQVITVPTNGDSRLDSFGLSFAMPPNNVDPSITAHVYAWDGQKATGPSLYDSPVLNGVHLGWATTLGFHADYPPPASFLTGGIDLTPGQQYVIFVASAPSSVFYLGFLDAGQPGYAGGSLVALRYANPFDPNNSSLWTTQAWNTNLTAGPRQIGFVANFSAPIVAASVPEPATLASAGLALMAGLLFRPRRAKRGD